MSREDGHPVSSAREANFPYFDPQRNQIHSHSPKPIEEDGHRHNSSVYHYGVFYHYLHEHLPCHPSPYPSSCPPSPILEQQQERIMPQRLGQTLRPDLPHWGRATHLQPLDQALWRRRKISGLLLWAGQLLGSISESRIWRSMFIYDVGSQRTWARRQDWQHLQAWRLFETVYRIITCWWMFENSFPPEREVLGAHIWGERTVRLDGSARFGMLSHLDLYRVHT